MPSYTAYHKDDAGVITARISVQAHSIADAIRLRNDNLFRALVIRYPLDERRRLKEWRANCATDAEVVSEAVGLGTAGDLYT